MLHFIKILYIYIYIYIINWDSFGWRGTTGKHDTHNFLLSLNLILVETS